MSYSRWGEETPNQGLKKNCVLEKASPRFKNEKRFDVGRVVRSVSSGSEVSGSIPATSELFSSESLMLKK